MNALLAWLKSKNVSSHSVALITSTFDHHSKFATDLILLAGIVAKYTKGNTQPPQETK